MEELSGLPDRRSCVRGEWNGGGVVWMVASVARKLYRCPGCEASIPPGAEHVYVHEYRTAWDHHHWHFRCVEVILYPELRRFRVLPAREARPKALNRRARRRRGRKPSTARRLGFQAKVRRVLEQAAGEGVTITRKELARRLGVRRSPAGALGSVVTEIQRVDHERLGEEAVLLGALLTTGRGEPTEGFFRSARELGYEVGDSEEERMAFWRRERARVFAAYRVGPEEGGWMAG